MECKICNEKIVSMCKCMRQDAICENGHKYHWSPFHNDYHEGISDHSKESNSPDCCEGKNKI